jgi:hypothetical protein
MTLAKAKAKTNETFITYDRHLRSSKYVYSTGLFTIVTYDRQNMFIVQATGLLHHINLQMLFGNKHSSLSSPCLRIEENKVL